MSRFDFRSPGAAFTSQIAETLAQRKAEERQMLLDKLTVNAEQRAQEAAARQAEEHKLQLSGMQLGQDATKQRMELDSLGALTEGMSRDTVPTSPEHAALLEKWGRLRDLPSPSVSSSTEVLGPDGSVIDNMSSPAGPPPPKQRGYVGTTKEQDQARQSEQTAQMIAQMMQNPETAESGQALARLAALNKGVINPNDAERYIGPAGRAVVFNEPTGQFMLNGKEFDASQMRPTDKIVQRGYAPNPPAPTWLGTSPDGQVGFVDRWGNVKTFDFTRGRGATGAAGGSIGSLNIPPAFLDDIALPMGAITQDPRAVTPESLAQFRNAMGLGFNAAKINASPKARQLATDLMYKGADERRVFVEQQRAAGQVSPQDIAAAMDMYSAIPQQVRDVLAANPYSPEAPKAKQSWMEFFNPFDGK